jgi:hypothetical protein
VLERRVQSTLPEQYEVRYQQSDMNAEIDLKELAMDRYPDIGEHGLVSDPKTAAPVGSASRTKTLGTAASGGSDQPTMRKRG